MKPFCFKDASLFKSGFCRAFSGRLHTAITEQGVQSLDAWLAFYNTAEHADMSKTEFCLRLIDDGFDLVWQRNESGKWLCIGASFG